MIDTAIVGAGPYGLSVAAYLRSMGVSFRIFGKPMDSWFSHMPKGMLLKSDGFASNICDPAGKLTLRQFCAERGIEYHDTDVPVKLATFTEYGLTFRERMVPELEEKMVTGLERSAKGFRLTLDTGENFEAERVVMAVGITHYSYVPEVLRGLPGELASHSYAHREPEKFRGRNVTVIGGGSSAIDLAGLLHEVNADVQLVARRQELKFHERRRVGEKRSLWERIRRPQSGLGPGLQSRFYANSPLWFHRLPEDLRLKIVRTHLGPSGGWFAKEMVMGKVPLVMGFTPERAEVRGGKVHLLLRGTDGTTREITTDHVVAATGYKVDLERLKFMSPELRTKIRTTNGSPILSNTFETSVRGLHFIGVSAANSFGPLMRFAYGAGFTAQRLTHVLKKSVSTARQAAPAESAVAVTK